MGKGHQKLVRSFANIDYYAIYDCQSWLSYYHRWASLPQKVMDTQFPFTDLE
jgi:hypothetical protein